MTATTDDRSVAARATVALPLIVPHGLVKRRSGTDVTCCARSWRAVTNRVAGGRPRTDRPSASTAMSNIRSERRPVATTSASTFPTRRSSSLTSATAARMPASELASSR